MTLVTNWKINHPLTWYAHPYSSCCSLRLFPSPQAQQEMVMGMVLSGWRISLTGWTIGMPSLKFHQIMKSGCGAPCKQIPRSACGTCPLMFQLALAGDQWRKLAFKQRPSSFSRPAASSCFPESSFSPCLLVACPYLTLPRCFAAAVLLPFLSRRFFQMRFLMQNWGHFFVSQARSLVSTVLATAATMAADPKLTIGDLAETLPKLVIIVKIISSRNIKSCLLKQMLVYPSLRWQIDPSQLMPCSLTTSSHPRTVILWQSSMLWSRNHWKWISWQIAIVRTHVIRWLVHMHPTWKPVFDPCHASTKCRSSSLICSWPVV